VISGSGGLTKTGSGTLTLAGANTFTGGWAVNAGTLNYNGSLAAGGQLTVNGSGANSVVNAGPGANLNFNGNSPLIGDNASGAGALFQSGGNISRINQFQLGAVTGGAYGYYNLSGGTNSMLEFDLGSFNGAAVGVCDMSGGVINVTNWFVPSRGNAAIGILNMTGGAFNYFGPSGQFLGNWNGGVGMVVLNIANASMIASNANVNLMQNGQVGKLGEINLLSGGFLQANGIAPGSATGTSMVNFNGGTLKAVTGNANFLTANNSSVNVYSGGGTIDNNGVNITIPKPLTAPAGSGLNGSVTINSGGSGYIGAPAVTFTNGGGTGAAAYATISGGAVT
ncbi:MAG TPA: autotransporter-associated beta strand repeat-containing protein, partial [Candidatus Binatia bacterium]|nr:autotransporter-associated beta strand repeat-containing protein [Candidatus Binatia bacterium]